MKLEATTVGCFICGRTRAAADAIHASCGECGATVGMCKLCSFHVPGPVKFLVESIEWHQQHGRCSGRLDVQVDAIVTAMLADPTRAKLDAAAARARALNRARTA